MCGVQSGLQVCNKGPRLSQFRKLLTIIKKEKKLTCKLFISPFFILISASFCAISVSSTCFSFPSSSMSLVIMSNSGFEYEALLFSYGRKSMLPLIIKHNYSCKSFSFTKQILTNTASNTLHYKVIFITCIYSHNYNAWLHTCHENRQLVTKF